jgi:hypothetical protein
MTGFVFDIGISVAKAQGSSILVPNGSISCKATAVARRTGNTINK